jgi:hypothetical protein
MPLLKPIANDELLFTSFLVCSNFLYQWTFDLNLQLVLPADSTLVLKYAGDTFYIYVQLI